MPEILTLLTMDHPEAFGRTGKKGECQYILQFSLEDGRVLVLKLGQVAYEHMTQFLLDAMANTPDYNDGSLDRNPNTPQ